MGVGQVSTPLLQVQDLCVEFRGERGSVRAVDSISFEVGPRETLAFVGESGCGKSVTALSILRLIPSPPGASYRAPSSSKARPAAARRAGIRPIRGNRIAMIFQEPMTSLNPVLHHRLQVGEPLDLHHRLP